MQNDNFEEFSMEDYNKFLKQIKAGSPVHKINFTLESPNAVVGMYLITMENLEEYLDKVVDKADLNDNTLLVFESRHVVECCQIIYGCLNILKSINMINERYYRNGYIYEVIIESVIDKLLSRPIFYYDLVYKMNTVVNSYIKSDHSKESEKIYKKLLYIMRNIWFVPYGQIDEMANEAIEEFKKHCEDNENDE